MFISEAVAGEAKIEVKDETGATQAGTVASGEQMPYDLSVDKMLMDTLGFLALLFGIFYFLLIRPQQKRVSQHKAMVETVKKGSRVITAGGIIGVVHKLEGDQIVVVEISPNVRVRVAKDAISEVLEEGKGGDSTANDN